MGNRQIVPDTQGHKKLRKWVTARVYGPQRVLKKTLATKLGLSATELSHLIAFYDDRRRMPSLKQATSIKKATGIVIEDWEKSA